MEESEAFRILLLHDGDLEFVAALLREFGVCFDERRGGASKEDREGAWNLVVANATRIRELPAVATRKGVRIAILNEDSRTVRSTLRRLGVDLMVRRPVHPAAFRLLLLHALYNGPERRHSARASVGGPVQIRVGLRKHEGVLLDISHSGCRVLSDAAVTRRKRLKIYIPAELAGDKKLVLKGSTARTERMQTASGVKQAIGIVFDTLKLASRKRLMQIVRDHKTGPAIMAASEQHGVPVAPEQTVGETISTTSQAPARRRRNRPTRNDTREAGDGSAADSAVEDLSQQSGIERRRDSRHDFERRVIVLSEEAARVLLGRDLAAGGMRVESDGSLAIGDALRIALHVRSGEVPLVVCARVLRDDGDRGVVLGFEDLSDAEKNYLDKMVGTLPVMSGEEGEDGESGENSGVVVTEILERS